MFGSNPSGILQPGRTASSSSSANNATRSGLFAYQDSLQQGNINVQPPVANRRVLSPSKVDEARPPGTKVAQTFATRLFDNIQRENVKWDNDKMWRQYQGKKEMEERRKHGRSNSSSDEERNPHERDRQKQIASKLGLTALLGGSPEQGESAVNNLHLPGSSSNPHVDQAVKSSSSRQNKSAQLGPPPSLRGATPKSGGGSSKAAGAPFSNTGNKHQNGTGHKDVVSKKRRKSQKKASDRESSSDNGTASDGRAKKRRRKEGHNNNENGKIKAVGIIQPGTSSGTRTTRVIEPAQEHQIRLRGRGHAAVRLKRRSISHSDDFQKVEQNDENALPPSIVPPVERTGASWKKAKKRHVAEEREDEVPADNFSSEEEPQRGRKLEKEVKKSGVNRGKMKKRRSSKKDKKSRSPVHVKKRRREQMEEIQSSSSSSRSSDGNHRGRDVAHNHQSRKSKKSPKKKGRKKSSSPKKKKTSRRRDRDASSSSAGSEQQQQQQPLPQHHHYATAVLPLRYVAPPMPPTNFQ
ncbi:unnamed protein product [Amoebophrya sp. A120]|nr:unnamed protein product [Amoebophrya sp. A120]|eukprot:GSA120T00019116001.1